MNHLVIIGNGVWGSALAVALASNFERISLIGIILPEYLKQHNTHPALGVEFPANVECGDSYNCITNDSNVLIAAPSSAFGDILENLSQTTFAHIAWTNKGFYQEYFLHTLFQKIFPHLHPCVISGPSFAAQIARNQPTALVVASDNTTQQQFWSRAVRTKYIKPYLCNDVVGVEIGGCLKNIYAIAAGITTELGFGINTTSALISRGLAEMIRFGEAMGAQEHTFIGLSGLGDLTLTCLDDASRNRRFGKYIAKGIGKKQALIEVGATVEGLHTLEIVIKMCKKYEVSMPICEQIYNVVCDSMDAKTAVMQLLSREIVFE